MANNEALKNDYSTATVEHKQKPLQSDSTPTKVVRFADSPTSYENEGYFKEDAKDLWYSSDDLQRFRANTRTLAKMIGRAEKISRNPYSFHRVLMRTYQVCCEEQQETTVAPLSIEERHQLTKWARKGPGVGIEKWSCVRLSKDKSSRRKRIVQVVLEAQRRRLSVNTKAEIIRSSSLNLTRSSRLFAQCLGQAQLSVAFLGQ